MKEAERKSVIKDIDCVLIQTNQNVVMLEKRYIILVGLGFVNESLHCKAEYSVSSRFQANFMQVEPMLC